MEHHEKRPKLLFADDHQLVLDALRFMAESQYDVRMVDTFGAFEKEMEEFVPDLGVLDVRMPDGDGFDVARRILGRHPQAKLMFLSMHNEPRYIKQASDLGAAGYLSKKAPAEELLLAIKTVLNGGKYIGSRVQSAIPDDGDASLTDRQVEVLRLISQGLSAKEIANQLNISVRTAEFHRAAIMDRLKLHSTAMMTRYAVDHGIV
jgi:two-component system nitrate/nitrite response regulator NarL